MMPVGGIYQCFNVSSGDSFALSNRTGLDIRNQRIQYKLQGKPARFR